MCCSLCAVCLDLRNAIQTRRRWNGRIVALFAHLSSAFIFSLLQSPSVSFSFLIHSVADFSFLLFFSFSSSSSKTLSTKMMTKSFGVNCFEHFLAPCSPYHEGLHRLMNIMCTLFRRSDSSSKRCLPNSDGTVWGFCSYRLCVHSFLNGLKSRTKLFAVWRC